MAGFDPGTGVCKFRTSRLNCREMSKDTTNGAIMKNAVGVNIYYSIPHNNLPKIDLYYTPEVVQAIFANLGGPNTRKFVCELLSSPGCANVLAKNGNITVNKCIEALEKSDVAEGELSYLNSDTQGCHALHAVFVRTNPTHCTHISLFPLEDENGKTKCQKSEALQPTALFTQDDLAQFRSFCNSAFGTDSCFVEDTSLGDSSSGHWPKRRLHSIFMNAIFVLSSMYHFAP